MVAIRTKLQLAANEKPSNVQLVRIVAGLPAVERALR